MEKLLEKGLKRVKQFYIDQLVKTGKYQPKDKELDEMTISELKYMYQQETGLQPKRAKLYGDLQILK